MSMENVMTTAQTQVVCNANTANAVVQRLPIIEFTLGEDTTHREKGGEKELISRSNSGKECKVRIDLGSMTYPAELQQELFKEQMETIDRMVKLYKDDAPGIVEAIINMAQQFEAAEEADFKSAEEPKEEAPVGDEFDETR